MEVLLPGTGCVGSAEKLLGHQRGRQEGPCICASDPSLKEPRQGGHLPLGTGKLRWAPGWELRLAEFSRNVSLLSNGIRDGTMA